MPKYYDIDDFLAEEELVPCTTNCDFSYLSFLDPDNTAAAVISGGSKSKRSRNSDQDLLAEHSKLKMPIWSLHSWADLGFVLLQIPKEYNRKTRELLAADPAHVHLRESYFTAGMSLLNLCERSAHKIAKQGRRGNPHIPKLEALLQECKELRATLLQTYAGERLSRTLNWALSSVGDDVSSYVQTLTATERRLYKSGAVSSASHTAWKQFAQARLIPFIPASNAPAKIGDNNASDKSGNPNSLENEETGQQTKRSRTS